jgi:hypothetical protein
MIEDAAIRIDQTTLQSVYTCTQLGMAPGGDQLTEPTLPCKLSVVTVPSCIRPSKRSPSQRELHRNSEMPPCGHMGDTLRGWAHSHLSPTDTLYPADSYGPALAELNSALTPLSARWCVRKSYRQVDPLAFRLGQAHVLHLQVTPQHLCSENRKSGSTLRSAPSSPISDRLFRAHPHQSTQNAFSYRFYPTHAKNHYSHPNTRIANLSAYTRLYTYIVVGQSRTG